MTPVTVERGLVFTSGGETTLGLDLYRAPQTDAPLVIYVHGGGWRSGDKADAGTERLGPLAAYGVTVASVDYRLVPGATFPDQVHDLKGAVRWLRAYGPSLGVRTDHTRHLGCFGGGVSRLIARAHRR